MPVLTPIGLDPAHPFPRVLNKSLNFVVELEGKDAFGRKSGIGDRAGAARAAARDPRCRAQIAGGEHGFVFLSSILHAHVARAVSRHEGARLLSVPRHAQQRSYVDEEEGVKNLRKALQGELPQRQFGDAVRLEVADKCSPGMIDAVLLQQFGLTQRRSLPRQRPGQIGAPVADPRAGRPAAISSSRRSRPALPRELREQPDIFDAHAQAATCCCTSRTSRSCRWSNSSARRADDPHVVAIKQTVYRTGAQVGNDGAADPRGAQRQGSHGRGRADGALRRGGEHQLGAAPGGGRRARRLRRGRPQDACEDGAGRAARRRAELCAATCISRTGNYHPRTARLYTDFGLFTVQRGDRRRRQARCSCS